MRSEDESVSWIVVGVIHLACRVDPEPFGLYVSEASTKA
jgi:hypothetical protein